MIDVDNINPETLYVIWNDRTSEYTYVRTPDGVGCYWYDDNQEDEARGDVCEVERVMHFDSHREFDDYRYREN